MKIARSDASRLRRARALAGGFTLVEMIVVTLLLLDRDAGAARRLRRERPHQQERDGRGRRAGAVRYGIYQMTRAIRMAGAGGLYVTQAVLNHDDPRAAGHHSLGRATPTTTSPAA